MLKTSEIKQFIDQDTVSEKKRFAKIGQAYYEGNHDIKQYRLFYYNADGDLVEDKTRSNIKIPHSFFTEIIDQATQYILSGCERIITSPLPELQVELDKYFNKNEDFMAEFAETITGCGVKGSEYMYAYKNAENRTAFQCADSIGVVEVEARFASDKKDHILYWYVYRVDKEGKKIKRIMDWDDENIYFYKQTDDGKVKIDDSEPINPKPHTLYKRMDDKTYYDGFGFIPFFRLDNNKNQQSGLKPIKELIDDYDIINCGLSNNLVDFDTPIHVVKGYEGDNLDQLQQNIKTKKLIGMESTDTGAGLDIKTVDIPYQARLAKLQENEKNIFRFGMGLNTSGLKDTSATTNIAIKAAYSLLDLKCSKLEIRLKQFLRKIVKVVLDEINKMNNTNYRITDVDIEFKHEIMANAQENAQIALTEAQEQQTRITTLLNLASKLDSETIMQAICEEMNIDYEKIKGKLPNPAEAEMAVDEAQGALDSVQVDEEEVKEQAEEEVGVALNGAQTQSLLSIISQYKAGSLTADEAVSIISIAIGISEARARKLLRLDV